LVEQLEQVARWKGIEVEQAAHDALVRYIGRLGREKIERESEAFEAMRAEWLKRYAGQYVAVHEGHVVEHAPNLRALRRKVYARFGHTPILHKRIMNEPEREIVIRSPRLERD
jgi:hypothetical protein